jgi:hypothetical protein
MRTCAYSEREPLVPEGVVSVRASLDGGLLFRPANWVALPYSRGRFLSTESRADTRSIHCRPPLDQGPLSRGHGGALAMAKTVDAFGLVDILMPIR